MSDLHLEFGAFDVPDIERDVVILAGDIHYSRALEKFLKRLSEKTKVVFVAGNHEYYFKEYCQKGKFLRSIRSPNVYFLDNGYVQIDGITFVGCTLWTDMNHNDPSILNYIHSKMNDYNIISLNGTPLIPENTVQMHGFSVGYLNHCLSNFDPRTSVLITHHAPSFKSTSCWEQSDPINYAYASDLHWLIEKHNPLLWVHGHIHCSFDYFINKTRVVCNPRGYFPDHLNPSFNPNFIIEI